MLIHEYVKCIKNFRTGLLSASQLEEKWVLYTQANLPGVGTGSGKTVWSLEVGNGHALPNGTTGDGVIMCFKSEHDAIVFAMGLKMTGYNPVSFVDDEEEMDITHQWELQDFLDGHP